MNISLKFTLFCLALVLFSCLALLYLANYQTQSSLREEIKVKLERESNFALENIDRFVYERLNDITTFAKDGVISRGTYGKNKATANEINERLTLFSKSNPLYLNLSYFDTSRIRITDTDTTAYILIGQRHGYTKYWTRISKEAVVLDISFSEESKQAPVIHFASKVQNQKGEYVGVIVSQILVSNLNQLFRSIIEDETHKNRKLGVALLDSTGNILYSNELKNNKLQEKYPEIGALNAYIKKQTKQQRLLPNYFESEGKVFFYIKDNGYEAYRGQQWTLVMSLPKEVAYKDAEDLKTRLLLTSIPILLVAMFLALFFGQYFSYPIITLTEAVEELEKGNLNINLTVQKEFSGHKHDEIGVLWSHFVSMAGKLKFKMLEQEDLNHELVNINDQLKVKFDEVQLKNEEIQSQHEKMSQQKRHLELAVKEIEKKNKNITASINYAERIQSAILPDRDYIKSLFPESFVLFKPRDIVSGDFYWFRKMVSPEGDELIAVAAVDCTGHGVPGALMSVIGDTLMYQVIVVERTFEPTQVLRKLNNGVKKILKQDDQHHHNKHDGMDMALCIVNKTKMTLQYVGAHRPLWYFQNNIFHEIEGDRVTVGGVSRRKQELNMHEINIHKGDTFYIFSDGYADQFGGYRNTPARKYSPKRLRKLLADVQSHDMPTQSFILDNEFELWKGSESQLDDVMVIGIRF